MIEIRVHPLYHLSNDHQPCQEASAMFTIESTFRQFRDDEYDNEIKFTRLNQSHQPDPIYA